MTDAVLVRSVPFELTRDAADGDGNTLEGYAAVFDSPTRIASWEGTFDESIARGAFKKSLREKTPVIQFDHGRHPMVGSIPLGPTEIAREDAQGLYVKSPLHDNWLVQPVRDAVASGSISGMSFRFQVVKDEWRDVKGNVLTEPAEIQRLLYNPDPKGPLQRTLKEVRVLELGPVVFPAYQDTSVGVRSEQFDALRAFLSDPESRADLARLLLTSTSDPASGDERSPAGDEAASTTAEPGDHSATIPDPRARDNALRRYGVK